MTTAAENPEFEALLNHVKRSRGFDFTGYKRSTLMRRVLKRMQVLEIEGFSNYLDYLEVHPEEFNFLFNTLLINVTSFFRDRSAWDYISSEIIPQIVRAKEPGERIRIWSAGCASGQEAYTVAMAIAEIIGLDQFHERVKIYATDVDTEALSQARLGTYSFRDIGDIPPELVEKYLEASEGNYSFRNDLRRSVIFGRHDLIQDAPISKIDLLLCRNTLMYFNAETQARILARFHFALRTGGFLFLGKAEMLLAHATTFPPQDLKRRVFVKAASSNLRDRLLSLNSVEAEEEYSQPANLMRLQEVAFNGAPLARLVVDTEGNLALANDRVRSLFNIAVRDLNRPLQDLEVSYRPVELRSWIEQVYSDRHTITLRDVVYSPLQGETMHLEVQVSPLIDGDKQIIGVSITFTDVSPYKRLQEELEHSNQELEMAYEELQSSNEELETTNEELQSSNEELETTNEELQSTNEELETMNEELQATNEEMQTINDELQRRGEELNQSNAFLEAILTSLRAGVVVVDTSLSVQIWNRKAEDLWGLRSDETFGQNFLTLDIGLPVGQLHQTLRNCLSNGDYVSEVLLESIDRRGRSIDCQVTCTPLLGPRRSVQGVILLMEARNENPPNSSPT